MLDTGRRQNNGVEAQMIEPTWKMVIRTSWVPWAILLGLLSYLLITVNTVPMQNQEQLKRIERRLDEEAADRQERLLQYRRNIEELKDKLDK